MSEQWLRKCKLTVQLQKGTPEALDFSEFRITFRVAQPTVDQPKYAEIYIYNLSENTINQLCEIDEGKGSEVILEVGYGSNPLQMLFHGTVFQYRKGRDNPTDTWLCILAQVADGFKQNAVINQCVPAGTTVDDAGKVLVRESMQHGIREVRVEKLSDQKYPRGRVFFGSLNDHLRDLAHDNNMAYYVSDNTINMYPPNKYTPKEAIELSLSTGMIGMPMLTSEGLDVTCLLNPEIIKGVNLKVDLTNLQSDAYDINYTGQQVDQPQKNPKMATNAQGYFVVQSVEHYGDTRGNEWFTKTISTAPGAVVPMTGRSITAVN